MDAVKWLLQAFVVGVIGATIGDLLVGRRPMWAQDDDDGKEAITWTSTTSSGSSEES